jgi:hypothetical protein
MTLKKTEGVVAYAIVLKDEPNRICVLPFPIGEFPMRIYYMKKEADKSRDKDRDPAFGERVRRVRVIFDD